MMIAKHVRKLAGYVPGEQPKSKKVVKLNTNENAYPPSPKCAEVLKSFDLDRLRRYCDPDCTALREALAKLNHTTPDRIFVGNGSDEILALCAKTFVENDESIGSLDPSYSLYKTLSAIRNVPWVGAGEGQEKRSPKEDKNSTVSPATCHLPPATCHLPPATCHLSPATCHLPPVTCHLPPATCHLPPATCHLPPSTSLFLLTNPNAPTGEWREPEEIAKFAKKFKGVVLVDEAYGDFARGNCMELATAETNKNLLVMRTFSKSFSLAGLRVGYCVGPKDLIDALVKVKDSYNVDAIAQAVALAAVKDIAWMRKNVKAIVETREWFTSELVKRGWDVIPSESNFVFARPPSQEKKKKGEGERWNAENIFNALKQRNIFVRYFSGPKTGDRLRVTIGTPAQMKKLLAAIDAIMKK